MKTKKDALQKQYEKQGEKWLDVTQKGFERFLDSQFGDSRFEFERAFLVDSDHTVIKMHGGLNGVGDWKVYIKEIACMLKEVNCYIIRLDYDVADDVFTLYLGMPVEK